jgi:hypothetical protein
VSGAGSEAKRSGLDRSEAGAEASRAKAQKVSLAALRLRSIRRFAPHPSLKLGAALQAFADATRRSPCFAQARGGH